MYFVGLSAGGLVIYSSVHLFGAKQFKPISRLAVLQAAVCMALAALIILSDLERPERIIWFLLTPNFKSPFILTSAMINLYLILCVIDLWIMMTGKGGERLALALTLIALPMAVLVHSTTAWVLGLQKARELWNSAIMAPLFLSSAMVSGIALLIVMIYAVQRATKLKFERSMFNSLAKLLATVIAVDVFFLFFEIMNTVYPTSTTPGHLVRIMILLAGRYSPIFYAEIFLAGIIPFFLLAIPKTRVSPLIQIVASTMVLIGIFLKRFLLLVMGFAISPIGPVRVSYFPTLVEILITLAVTAVGVLIVTIAIKLLPMEVPEGGH
jgi:molybdopterin-containing oxidoreductase family membrane subunit